MAERPQKELLIPSATHGSAAFSQYGSARPRAVGLGGESVSGGTVLMVSAGEILRNHTSPPLIL